MVQSASAPYVLLSVSDRSGIDELARSLAALKYRLVATGGTATHLRSLGLSVLAVEDLTGFPEMLDGRVKTLHPKIHGGLLAKRSNPSHVRDLSQHGINAFDIAVVNLYPFVRAVTERPDAPLDELVELIDVGGPTMLRAAAKNFGDVLVIVDPADYPHALALLKEHGSVGRIPFAEKRKFAGKVFAHLSRYDEAIAKVLLAGSTLEPRPQPRSEKAPLEIPAQLQIRAPKIQELRYGENPHQKAAFFAAVPREELPWVQLGGKELSYNNLLDLDAALGFIEFFSEPRSTAVIIKHLTACGAARAETLGIALTRAKLSDPRSHFGGVFVANCIIEEGVAAELTEDFAELVVAPGFSDPALAKLRERKNLRVLRFTPGAHRVLELRSAAGGILAQEPDTQPSAVTSFECVTDRGAVPQELEDLDFAWRLCARVKSNAIVVARDNQLLGCGAGQTSRIDSVEVALSKARFHKHSLEGAVAASDAFFPFPDSVEKLAEAGIKAIVSPKGAQRDKQAVEAANSAGLSLYFATERHFRH